MEPLVSIVLCTYNGSNYLKEQFDSIISQTYKNLEIIVVDDASADNSATLINGYCKIDNRIKLFVNECNLGYNKNFENACKLASGQFIAFSDQDDIWETNKISFMMHNLWADKDTLLVHCNSATFKTGGRVCTGSVKARHVFRGNDARMLFMNNRVSGHNIIVKKELLQMALPVPDKIYYDWWLAVVACCNGNVEATDKIFVYHRRHSCNATDTEKKPLYYEAVLSKLPLLLKTPNLPKDYEKFGNEMLEKFKTFSNKKFSIVLFLFLLKHSSIIFSFKRKVFPYFSYLKHAARIANASCKAP